MKLNKTSQALFTKVKSDFVSTIKGIFDIVYSSYLIKEKSSILVRNSYPKIISGQLNLPSSKFCIKAYMLNLDVYYEVKEVFQTDYYGRIKYHVYKTIPETFEFDLVVEVFSTDLDECLIYSSFIYDYQIHLTDKEIQDELQQRSSIYNSLELSLNRHRNELNKVVLVYTSINCKMKLSWNILLNMKIVHKFVSLLADKVDYDKEFFEKEDIICLFYKNKLIKTNKTNKNNNIINNYNNYTNIFGKVSKFYFWDETAVIELLLSKEKKVAFTSDNKIIIRLYECEGKTTMYIFFMYNKPLHEKIKKEIYSQKLKELEKFKQIVEHFNDKSLYKLIAQNSVTKKLIDNLNPNINNNNNNKSLISNANKNKKKSKRHKSFSYFSNISISNEIYNGKRLKK